MPGTATVAISGNDTFTVRNRVITQFADGDISALTYPNDIAAVKTGKNGNSIYSLNATGLQADAVLRVMRGSDDDKFLNGVVQEWVQNPAGFILLDGQLVKRIGDGRGNIGNDTYLMTGGVPTKQVNGLSNVEGSTDQSVSLYTFKFTNAPRALL